MLSYISVFDMLKIGVGPSSSHTLGPWRAAERFIDTLREKYLFQKVTGIQVKLYGSLSLTGKGHATDLAVILGLSGLKPETVKTESIGGVCLKVKEDKILNLNGQNSIKFDPAKDIEFINDFLPFHPNGISFLAFLKDGSAYGEIYYSIGGGFIVQENETNKRTESKKIPFVIHKGEHIIEYLKLYPSFKISDFAMQNEIALGKTEKQTKQDLIKIWNVMSDSIFTGITTEGILPGGLGVKRRAKAMLFETLKGFNPNSKEEFFQKIKNLETPSFNDVLDFISIFALAVNEVNASLGRVVTAPTNGSAGVIPAVLAYYLCFVNKNASENEISKFLLTAGVIGGIFKNGATISAAAGGCQAEIGVSSAMAAAALTESLGGTPEEAMTAAEIAMEHHLGMTCDPVGGLVQIPCIERNTMGAIKAINAANLALKTNPHDAKISLDNVVKTMRETAEDMNVKYKETSTGGLALRLSVKNPEC